MGSADGEASGDGLAGLAAATPVPRVVLISVVIGWHGARSHRHSQEIRRLLGDLARSQRLDQLAGQARTLTDLDELRGVRAEAGALGDQHAIALVRKHYWANPAVPLSSTDPSDPDAIAVAQRNLAAKLAAEPGREIEELTRFVALARSSRAFESHLVAVWIKDELASEASITDAELRRLLTDAPDAMFGWLLLELDSVARRLPSATYVNILAGVASAYLERSSIAALTPMPKPTSATTAPFWPQGAAVLARY